MKKNKSKNEKLESYELDERSDLSYYFDLVKKYPPLLREEEDYLFKEIREGNKKAEEKLLLSNLRFVIWVAKKYKIKEKEIPLIDLISEGNIGLMKAIKKYDPEKYKNKFSSYAFHWIYSSIENYINKTSKGIYIPIHMNKKKKFFEYLQEDSFKSIKSLDSLLHRFSFDEKSIKKIKNLPTCYFYNEKEEPLENFSIFNDLKTSENDPFYETSQNIIKEQICQIINENLNERERDVIFMRYGLVDNKKRTLREIAEKLNISRERVRQIQEKSLEKLKDHLEIFKNEI
jgi:RNA polymerase primary sigma factor